MRQKSWEEGVLKELGPELPPCAVRPTTEASM